tara:strand:- start:1013 stop:1933 length:921 start_codon:yes stop_codon:yes gene_type:complete
MKKIKIYFQNAENALGKQKPEEFENSTDHMAYAFSKNENVEMVLNIDEADYIIRHPDIGIQNEPLNPEREIIIDYFDSDNQMSNVLGCDTNCIMSRNPLLYFKRSCVDKTKNPYEYRKYNSPYTPITYGIKESYLNNISENENRNIDASCLFNHHDNGGNRSAVAQFMQRFKEQNTKYEIHVGRIGGGYSYNSSKHYFDQIKNSKILVSCNPDGWEGDFRLFEALAGKALVFVDDMMVTKDKGLKHKEHLIYYKNLNELHEMLAYYLENQEEAKEIAGKGHEKSKKDFTYDSNCEMILKEIRKSNE